MALPDNAQQYLEKLFPGYDSTLLETDPEFIELFSNFAFDQVVTNDDLDEKTRMIAILVTLLGQASTSRATRLATGIQAQIDIFGQGMKDFWKSGPEISTPQRKQRRLGNTPISKRISRLRDRPVSNQHVRSLWWLAGGVTPPAEEKNFKALPERISKKKTHQ